MALDIDRIKKLYNGIPAGEKTKLIKYVWPKYAVNMSYFDKTKRPSYEVVEKLADYFGVTIDSLRLDPLSTQRCVPGTNLQTKRRSIYPIPEEPAAMVAEDMPIYRSSAASHELEDKNNEILRLKEQIEHLKETVRLKDDVIASKNEQIELLCEVMEGKK